MNLTFVAQRRGKAHFEWMLGDRRLAGLAHEQPGIGLG